MKFRHLTGLVPMVLSSIAWAGAPAKRLPAEAPGWVAGLGYVLAPDPYIGGNAASQPAT